jgi:hypothetical protein
LIGRPVPGPGRGADASAVERALAAALASGPSARTRWVKLRNRTSHRVGLDGWTLRDTAHHVYHFVGYSLRAHGTVRVHTGSGRDTQRNLFQDRRAYVWNNDGDTAILRGPAGNVRDRCSYSDRSERFASVDC